MLSRPISDPRRDEVFESVKLICVTLKFPKLIETFPLGLLLATDPFPVAVHPEVAFPPRNDESRTTDAPFDARSNADSHSAPNELRNE